MHMIYWVRDLVDGADYSEGKELRLGEGDIPGAELNDGYDEIGDVNDVLGVSYFLISLLQS